MERRRFTGLLVGGVSANLAGLAKIEHDMRQRDRKSAELQERIQEGFQSTGFEPESSPFKGEANLEVRIDNDYSFWRGNDITPDLVLTGEPREEINRLEPSEAVELLEEEHGNYLNDFQSYVDERLDYDGSIKHLGVVVDDPVEREGGLFTPAEHTYATWKDYGEDDYTDWCLASDQASAGRKLPVKKWNILEQD